MALDYSNQVTVRVWRNIKTRGLPTSHFGHASVELRVGAQSAYVSFWPGPDGAGLGLSALRGKTGQFESDVGGDKRDEMGWATEIRLEVGYRQANGIPIGRELQTDFDEIGKRSLVARSGQKRTEHSRGYFWSQSPEVKFKLPALGARGMHWGLSLAEMHRWWQQFEPQGPHYRALSRHNNCAGVALMALKAGGADAFLELPSPRIYAEPLQVERYSEALLAKMTNMETQTNALDQDVRAALGSGVLKPAMIAGSQVDGLWTVSEWKKQSALGPLQTRSSTIRSIDDALGRYHGARWDADYLKKYRALIDVFRGLVAHREQKATSARSGAVLALAVQVVGLLRNNGPLFA